MPDIICISGITGFLGSSVAAHCVSHGHKIIGLKRSSSDIIRCDIFSDKVYWINTDVEGWQETLVAAKPNIIVHAAWNGVRSDARNTLKSQLSNLDFIADLLVVAQDAGVKKIIGFGSQAEYGQINGVVSEASQLNPNSFYGIAKTLASKLIEEICTLHKIDWYWLRIFSVFGEKESGSWLIPSIVTKLSEGNKVLNFSPCTQKYAYLYSGDFVKFVSAIVDAPKGGPVGVYNVSGINAIAIKQLIEKAVFYSGAGGVTLNFGALPFREGQSMHIEGDISKFCKNFGPISFSDFDSSLKHTVKTLMESYSPNPQFTQL